MKKWKKVVGVVGLSLLFTVPVEGLAMSEEYVYLGDYGLRDSIYHQYKRNFGNKELEELDKLLADGKITEQEYEEQEASLSERLDKEFEFTEKTKLFTPDFMKSVERISPDWTNTVSGLEQATNLKELTGEGGPISDLRPIRGLKKLETLWLASNKQNNLKDLSNLKNLKNLKIYTSGFANEEEEADLKAQNSYNHTSLFTQTLLTDISVLSDLEKLEKFSIFSQGIMAPVTLKKGTTSYSLYDPIILSTQFNDRQISYRSYLENINSDYSFESNEELKWKELTGEEEFLSFSWNIKKGEFIAEGEGQIPIRWK